MIQNELSEEGEFIRWINFWEIFESRAPIDKSPHLESFSKDATHSPLTWRLTFRIKTTMLTIMGCLPSNQSNLLFSKFKVILVFQNSIVGAANLFLIVCQSFDARDQKFRFAFGMKNYICMFPIPLFRWHFFTFTETNWIISISILIYLFLLFLFSSSDDQSII